MLCSATNPPFYVLWLGVQRIVADQVVAEVETLQVLQAAIEATGNSVLPVNDVSPLFNAQAALQALAASAASRASSVVNITTAPAYQQLMSSTNTFLSGPGQNVKWGGGNRAAPPGRICCCAWHGSLGLRHRGAPRVARYSHRRLCPGWHDDRRTPHAPEVGGVGGVGHHGSGLGVLVRPGVRLRRQRPSARAAFALRPDHTAWPATPLSGLPACPAGSGASRMVTQAFRPAARRTDTRPARAKVASAREALERSKPKSRAIELREMATVRVFLRPDQNQRTMLTCNTLPGSRAATCNHGHGTGPHRK